jgi:hypothetical protein
MKVATTPGENGQAGYLKNIKVHAKREKEHRKPKEKMGGPNSPGGLRNRHYV